MTDTPTVVEITTTPAPAATPPKPTNPPAAMPGIPLALAAANAAGTVASGALALGGPAALAVAGTTAAVLAAGGAVRRARNRTRGLRLHNPSGTGRTPTRGNALGRIPAARTGNSAGHGSAFGLGGPGASASRTAGRTPTHPAAHTPASAPGGRHRSASPGGVGPHPARHTTTSAGPARSRAHGHAEGTAPRRPGPARSIKSASQQSRSASRPGTVHDLRKPAGGSAVPAGRWPGLSPKKAAKIATRTDKRLAKGLARARKRAGLDPTTGTDAGAAGSKLAASEGASAQQAKMLRRSRLRHAARMTASGLIAGLVGAGSAAAFNWRHRGKVSCHVRAVWRRLADRARAVKQTRDAAILAGTTGKGQDSTTPVVPVPAETVNVPGREKPGPASALKRLAGQVVAGRTASRITLGKPTNAKEASVSDSESTVPAFSLSSAADVMLQAASTFDPEQMPEFGVLADDLPIAFATIQEVLRVLAEKGAEQLALEPVVSEEIAQGYQAMGRVVQALENVGPVFRQAHAADLDRYDNPRNGLEAERKWNV
ncbi:hypothetical protein [Kitasatospora terrestris]|uniref:Uncharacterized protein n=1 Tax=Kitasatospora terrestris TaxID=258051 RepID=A0ABP9E5F1_9ACTN